MPTINFLTALATQRPLAQAEGALAVSLQRLSSGLRINRAADDAAGSSISQRLEAQVRGLSQGARNANDGISVAQTADASLASMTTLLQRVRELAVQAANATNSAADRQQLDNESSQMLLEVERLANQTQLNGLQLLDGSYASRLMQVGANVLDTIGVGITDARLGSAAQYAYHAAASVDSRAITSGDLTIDAGSGPVAIIPSFNNGTYQDDTSAFSKAEAINGSGFSGVTATATTTAVWSGLAVHGAVAGASDGLKAPVGTPLGQASYTLNIQGVDIYSGNWIDMSLGALASAIDGQSASTGVSAKINSNGQLQLDSADGSLIEVNETFTAAHNAPGGPFMTDSAFSGGTANLFSNHGGLSQISPVYDIAGQITLRSTSPLQFGGAASNPQDLIGISSTPSVALDAAGFGLTTRQGALDSITAADRLVDTLNTNRAALGAMQNRLAAAAANASAAAQAAAATRSRVTDADYATETANFSRAMILRQSGIAITAQANSEPRLVLSLLKGHR